MAHFLDRLVAEMRDLPDGLFFQEFVDMLPRAEMFVANNVYEYFLKSDKFQDEIHPGVEVSRAVDISDFPNIAPPFETFFVAGSPVLAGTEGGTLFHARPIMENQHPAFSKMLEHAEIWSSRLDLHRKGVRWVLYAVPFVRWFSMIYPPLVCNVLLVKEDGKLYYSDTEDKDPRGFIYILDEELVPDMTRRFEEPDGGWALNDTIPSGFDFTFFAGSLEGRDKKMADLLCKVASGALLPSALALCFLHCRNVITVEHDPLVNRQARRQSERRQQKTGYGLIKFRTLEIESVKRVLKDEGNIEKNGLGVALHLCRGHFKDYREGPGLFGKHNGMWWWESQARGDASIGTVLKDYKMPRVTA